MSVHDRKPMNRREFLGRSLSAFSAAALVPAWWSAVAGEKPNEKLRRAVAEAMAGNPAPIPFMVFDLAGGPALPGNFLVGGKGGAEDLLQGYSTLGWDPRAAGALDSQFGLPMSAKKSQILTGILQTTTPEARKGLRMASICNFSQDDTGSNTLSAARLVSRVNNGSVVSAIVGITGRKSGGNSWLALATSSGLDLSSRKEPY